MNKKTCLFHLFFSLGHIQFILKKVQLLYEVVCFVTCASLCCSGWWELKSRYWSDFVGFLQTPTWSLRHQCRRHSLKKYTFTYKAFDHILLYLYLWLTFSLGVTFWECKFEIQLLSIKTKVLGSYAMNLLLQPTQHPINQCVAPELQLQLLIWCPDWTKHVSQSLTTLRKPVQPTGRPFKLHMRKPELRIEPESQNYKADVLITLLPCSPYAQYLWIAYIWI